MFSVRRKFDIYHRRLFLFAQYKSKVGVENFLSLQWFLKFGPEVLVKRSSILPPFDNFVHILREALRDELSIFQRRQWCPKCVE